MSIEEPPWIAVDRAIQRECADLISPEDRAFSSAMAAKPEDQITRAERQRLQWIREVAMREMARRHDIPEDAVASWIALSAGTGWLLPSIPKQDWNLLRTINLLVVGHKPEHCQMCGHEPDHLHEMAHLDFPVHVYACMNCASWMISPDGAAISLLWRYADPPPLPEPEGPWRAVNGRIELKIILEEGKGLALHRRRGWIISILPLPSGWCALAQGDGRAFAQPHLASLEEAQAHALNFVSSETGLSVDDLLSKAE